MEAATKASYAKHMKSPREILTERRRHAKEYAAVAAALEAASKSGSWPHKAKPAKAKPAGAGYKKWNPKPNGNCSTRPIAFAG